MSPTSPASPLSPPSGAHTAGGTPAAVAAEPSPNLQERGELRLKIAALGKEIDNRSMFPNAEPAIKEVCSRKAGELAVLKEWLAECGP